MNPASARYGASACAAGGPPSISSISMPRGESAPARARSMSARDDRAPDARSLRFGLRQIRRELPIAAREIRPERAVDQNHRRAHRRVGPRPASTAPRHSTQTAPELAASGALPRLQSRMFLRACRAVAASAAEAGHLSVAPYGFAGSVAASTATSGASFPPASRSDRSRSSAPGSENCVAPSPATK